MLECNGSILDRATRLRLVELADAFEFEDCVEECLESLGRNLTLEAAMIALDDIPEQLRNHDSICDLEELVEAALIKQIDKLARIYDQEGRERELLSKAGAVLAKLLGPVEDFYCIEPCEELKLTGRLGFYNQFELDEKIAELPATVMRVLLASDALEVTTENETYTLLIV